MNQFSLLSLNRTIAIEVAMMLTLGKYEPVLFALA
jgi:hypothetical protein